MNPLAVSCASLALVLPLMRSLYAALGLLGGIGMPNHHYCRILHLLPKRTAGTSL